MEFICEGCEEASDSPKIFGGTLSCTGRRMEKIGWQLVEGVGDEYGKLCGGGLVCEGLSHTLLMNNFF